MQFWSISFSDPMQYLFFLPQPKKKVESMGGICFLVVLAGAACGHNNFCGGVVVYDRAANPHIYMSTIDLSPNDTLALNIRG